LLHRAMVLLVMVVLLMTAASRRLFAPVDQSTTAADIKQASHRVDPDFAAAPESNSWEGTP
jgi:hypothetical protein